MKSNLFLWVILGVSVSIILPSYAINSKKIDEKGRYTIIAMIDNRLARVAWDIENVIRSSSLSRSYSPLPSNTYHMSLYTIFSAGNKLIPPIQRWVNETHQKVPKTNWLPNEVLKEKNDEATCVLAYYLNEPLIIKSAKVQIDDNVISLQLELQNESLQRIRNARRELQRVYEHRNSALEPIEEKVHVTLGLAFNNDINEIDTQTKRQLGRLAARFNESTLGQPYVYV